MLGGFGSNPLAIGHEHSVASSGVECVGSAAEHRLLAFVGDGPDLLEQVVRSPQHELSERSAVREWDNASETGAAIHGGDAVCEPVTALQVEQMAEQATVGRGDGSECRFGSQASVGGQSRCALDSAAPPGGMLGQVLLDGLSAPVPACVDVALDRLERVSHRFMEFAPAASQLTPPESQ